MEDGVFPHARSLADERELEEERRLAYVGITRAEQRLYLTRAVSRSVWGSPAWNPPSRFLDEIPTDLIDARGEVRREPATVSVGPIAAPGSPPRRRDTDTPVISLSPGDRVRHERFGVGTVVTVSGVGDKSDAAIDFGEAGVKRLLLRYAPVERIES
jgi:DNA helicase-2/ATP-dependent DNA helicase PcrA